MATPLRVTRSPSRPRDGRATGAAPIRDASRWLTLARAAAGPPRRGWLLEIEFTWYLLASTVLTVRLGRVQRDLGVPVLPDGPGGWLGAVAPWAAVLGLALARWWRPAWTGPLAVTGAVVCAALLELQDVVGPWRWLGAVPTLVMLPVLLAAAFRRGRWPSLVAAVVLLGLYVHGLLTVEVHGTQPGPPRIGGDVAVPIDQVLATVALVLLPAAIGLALRLLDQRRRTARLEATRVAERLQVARELHDLVAGHVTGMTMYAQAARTGDDPERLRGLLAAIETSGTDALAAMHRMVGALRARPGPDPFGALPTSATDLADAVRSAVGEDGRTTVTVEPRIAAATPPPDVLTSVHRVVTEAMSNVRRHAPAARAVTVAVSASRPGTLVVEIVNDGVARTVPGGGGGGFGLVGLTERISALGGELRAGPAGPRRWTVTAELPWDGARES